MHRGGHRIPLPGVGVEGCIAHVLVGSSMEVLRTRFGGNANLAPGRPAVFWRIIGREDLYLLRRIHIRRAQAGPVRPRAYCRRTIVSNQTLLRARPVDVRWSL